MLKKWTFKPDPDPEIVADLASKINVNKYLASILVQRNISSFELAKSFFRPVLSDLHDPFLMKDMENAVERLQLAIQNNEKILVYGDYDVDGTTAVALFYDFLKSVYSNVSYYIPDRYTEGYGLSKQGIQYAHENDFTLVITLDCGIKANTLVEEGNKLGLDFIIGDHHLPSVVLPKAYAVLDPKQPGCEYPYKELSGCGIAFKFLQAYCLKNNIDLDALYDYLDLLAVSIASDIVPMDGENRVLTYYGLKKLNEKPRPGLKALMKSAGITAVDINSIVFGIGPRINASGRIDHANHSVELLLAKDEDCCTDLANSINDNNTIRKNLDITITDEAIKMIENDQRLVNAKSTVLYKEDWHKGVIGIVASRCIEKYYRPTIILTKSDNKVTGSARSVVGFNIYNAIAACADLLERYGGHKYAAGLTLDEENVIPFQEKFERIVSETISDDQLIPQVVIDQKIEINRINHKFHNILKQFGPFGPENMDPVFVSEKLQVKGEPKLLNEEHIKFFTRQRNSHYAIEAIGFGMAHFFDELKSGKLFKMAYHIELNNHPGYNYLQLNIKDIKFE